MVLSGPPMRSLLAMVGKRLNSSNVIVCWLWAFSLFLLFDLRNFYLESKRTLFFFEYVILMINRQSALTDFLSLQQSSAFITTVAFLAILPLRCTRPSLSFVLMVKSKWFFQIHSTIFDMISVGCLADIIFFSWSEGNEWSSRMIAKLLVHCLFRLIHLTLFLMI